MLIKLVKFIRAFDKRLVSYATKKHEKGLARAAEKTDKVVDSIESKLERLENMFIAMRASIVSSHNNKQLKIEKVRKAHADKLNELGNL